MLLWGKAPGAARSTARSAVAGRFLSTAVSCVSLCVAFGLVCGLLMAPEWVLNAPFWVKIATLVWIMVSTYLLRRARQKCRILLYEHVAHQDYEVCLGCGYSLRGLPNRYKCPECAKPFDKADLRRAWTTWVDARRWPETRRKCK